MGQGDPPHTILRKGEHLTPDPQGTDVSNWSYGSGAHMPVWRWKQGAQASPAASLCNCGCWHHSSPHLLQIHMRPWQSHTIQKGAGMSQSPHACSLLQFPVSTIAGCCPYSQWGGECRALCMPAGTSPPCSSCAQTSNWKPPLDMWPSVSSCQP